MTNRKMLLAFISKFFTKYMTYFDDFDGITMT